MMLESTLPAPPASPESVEFVAAAKEGRFLIRRCTACGKAALVSPRGLPVLFRRNGMGARVRPRHDLQFQARCAGSIRRTRLPMSR